MAEKMTPNGLVVGLIPDNQIEDEPIKTASEVVDVPPLTPEKNKGGRPKKAVE